MTTMNFRFGILGTGTIARRFTREVAPVAHIHAVASRDKTKAKSFAKTYGISKSYASYAALLADEEIDAVYIATPASLHHSHCLMSIEAGRPVLCEKPFTMNACEAREIASAARQSNIFCMEAMWMRFNPLIKKARKIIVDGKIGDVKATRAEIGFRQPFGKKIRLLNSDLGGGSLLDLGVYGLSLAHYFFGMPNKISAHAKFHPTGVDEVVATILDYDGHVVTLTTSISTTPSNTALIMGSTGRIEIGSPFFNPNRIRVIPVTETKPSPAQLSLKRKLFNKLPFAMRIEQSQLMTALRGRNGSVDFLNSAGLRYQAEEVIQCISKKKIESDIMPLSASIAVMEMIDQIADKIIRT